MFENIRLPVKLKKSPIKKAIIEFRYEGNYPEQALYGLLMDSFVLTQTPIYNLPPDIRSQDINFKYQVILEGILKENDNCKYFFGIGNNSIQFTVLDSYISWDDWISLVQDKLHILFEKNIIKNMDSLSIQYTDIFDKDITKDINAQIVIGDKTVFQSPMSLATTLWEDDIVINVNIGSPININGKLAENKSLLDIKCTKKFESIEIFMKTYNEVLTKQHNLNKRYFFGLLKQELLDTLEPLYE